MSPGVVRTLRGLFFAYVAATFAHIAYVVNHEPFSFDAWNVSIDTGAKPFSIGRFFEFWHQQYTTSNPRLGQPLAYLAYKIGGFAEIVTPLAFFAIVLAGFVIGTRRFPSRKDNRDLATLAIGIGAMWFASTNFPAYMFCRAYATNYIWAIAIQLWFLVPIRLGGASAHPLKLAGYFVLGVAAGMCNEHTGPTLIAFTLGYAVWTWRKQRTWSPILWTGIAGAIVGYAIIFFAPGQSQRYEGVGEHYSALQQVLVRGISGNIDIYLDLMQTAAPLLIVAVFAMALGLGTEQRSESELVEARSDQRRALVFLAIAVLAASTITMTVFASPKLGPRFYLHSMMFVLASVLGLIRAFLHRPRAFAPLIAIGVIASGYAIARTVPSYTRTARASDRRLAELAATPRRGVYTAEAWDTISENWWTLGDDMRDQGKDQLIARYFDLDRVLFRGGDPWKPLGMSDVKLTMHYEVDPPVCLDQVDELYIAPWLGKDVAALHHAFLDAIVDIQRVAHVKKIDLTASFIGKPPPLPRKKLYIARWADGVMEGYVVKLKRAGRSSMREIALPAELQKSAWEIYVVAIGDEPRKLGLSTDKSSLGYEPWRSGNYWVTACKDDYCFILAATTHVVF